MVVNLSHLDDVRRAFSIAHRLLLAAMFAGASLSHVTFTPAAEGSPRPSPNNSDWITQYDALIEEAVELEAQTKDEAALVPARKALELFEHSGDPNDFRITESLYVIGAANSNLERYSAALTALTRANDIANTLASQPREVAKIKRGLAVVHMSITASSITGVLHLVPEPELAHLDQASTLIQQAIQIEQSIGYGIVDDKTWDVENDLARLLVAASRPAAAVPLLLIELSKRERQYKPGDPPLIDTQFFLGRAYLLLGSYADASKFLIPAVKAREYSGNAKEKTEAFTSAAEFYDEIGDPATAAGYAERALALCPKVSDSDLNLANCTTIQMDLGAIYLRDKKPEKALDHLDKTLSAINNKPALLERLSPDLFESFGTAYVALGDQERGLASYQRALRLREKFLGPDNIVVAEDLATVARTYSAMNNQERALPLLLRGMLIATQSVSQDPADERESLFAQLLVASNLCELLQQWRPGARTEEAIFYCKLAVNAAQRRRQMVIGLSPAQTKNFSEKHAKPYEMLSRLLVSKGRYGEAESVLLLLKESNLGEFILRDGGIDPGQIKSQALRWTPDQQEFADRMLELSKALSDQMHIVSALVEQVKAKKITYESKEWISAQQSLERLLERQSAQLTELSEQFAKDAKHNEADALVQEIAQRSEIQSRLHTLDGLSLKHLNLPTAAAITWLPDSESLTVLVTTSLKIEAVQVPIGVDELAKSVEELRKAIQNRIDYRPKARELYSWLIAPAEPFLRKGDIHISHLMMNAIGALQGVPFAALVDPVSGKHLVESYSISLITAQTAQNLDRQPLETWEIDAFGTSVATPEFGNVSLPAVREELCGIVRDEKCHGAIQGHRFEDTQFSRIAFSRLLGTLPSAEPVTAIHIATHYDVRRSRLLLGDPYVMPVSEFARMNLNLAKFDLMTLSACDSAVDGVGVESFAGLLQLHGAKAVLATLWSVEDEGTAKLMVRFYSNRGERRLLSKAEALSRAQRALLRGDVKSSNSKIDLRLPYYWAAFVLMGNWL